MIPAYWSPTRKLMVLGAMAGGKLVEDTATGNPLTFITDKAKPLKSLLIPFTPQQEGTGDPSPSNIRSILPWNGLKVFGGGKNLLNPVAENLIPFVDTSYNRYTLVNGQIITTGNTLVGFLVEVKEQTKYAFSFASESNTILEVFSYSAKPNKIRNADTQIAYEQTTKKASFVTPNGCKYVVCAIVSTVSANVISDFQLEVGQTATAYEPYKPITDTDISFPSPVYGGTLDVVSGVLTVEWAFRTDTGQNEGSWSGTTSGNNKRWVLNKLAFGDLVPKNNAQIATNYFKNASSGAWSAFFGSTGNFLCYVPIEVCEDKEAWLEYLAENPLQICYELDTPVEIQLTPEQITALLGNNTIWSDADGQMTAVYLKKG